MENYTKINEEIVLDLLKDLTSSEPLKSFDNDKLLKAYSLLANSCTLDNIIQSEDITYSEKDFSQKVVSSLHSMNLMKTLTEKLCQYSHYSQFLENGTMKLIIIKCIIAIGQFYYSNSLWSSSECALCANDIVELLCSLCQCSSLLELLVGKNNGSLLFVGERGILKNVLQEFSVKFNKKSWKKSLPYIDTYYLLLFALKSPHVAEYLSYLLPPALFFLDDWEIKHKIIGAKSLHHIISNTANSELRCHGRADVIFDALHHQMYTREADLFSQIFPAILLCSTAIENDPQHTRIFRKSQYDVLLDHLLREMIFEQRLDRRAVYARSLKEITLCMGFHMIRWSKDLINVCSEYLQVNEGVNAQDKINILDVLNIYSKTCWPRIHVHVKKILKMLLLMVYEISTDESCIKEEAKKTLMQGSKAIVKDMHAIAPKAVTDSLTGFELLNISAGPQKAISFIIADIL